MVSDASDAAGATYGCVRSRVLDKRTAEYDEPKVIEFEMWCAATPARAERCGLTFESPDGGRGCGASAPAEKEWRRLARTPHPRECLSPALLRGGYFRFVPTREAPAASSGVRSSCWARRFHAPAGIVLAHSHSASPSGSDPCDPSVKRNGATLTQLRRCRIGRPSIPGKWEHGLHVRVSALS